MQFKTFRTVVNSEYSYYNMLKGELTVKKEQAKKKLFSEFFQP